MGFCFYLRVPKHFSVLPMIRSVNDTEPPAYEKNWLPLHGAEPATAGTGQLDVWREELTMISKVDFRDFFEINQRLYGDNPALMAQLEYMLRMMNTSEPRVEIVGKDDSRH